MHITHLPTELVEEILVTCDPLEVAQVAQTCTAFRSLIYLSKDSKLWRTLYISQPLDDPRKCVSQDGRPKPQPISWRMELQRVIRARSIIESPQILRQGELEDVLQTLLSLVCYVPAWSSADNEEGEGASDISENLLWVAAQLGRNSWLDTIEALGNLNFAEKQLLARLHCYYGLTKTDIDNSAHAKSRAYVYNMSKYQPETDYGPFMSNGTVNWVHMQAIHHVVSMHVVDLRENQDFMFAIFPMTLPFTQIVLPDSPDEEKDWAGVAGKWQVAFCFCDHRELMEFNNHAEDEEMDVTMFENPGFREVFRWLDVNMVIKNMEHDPKHPTKPIIHFFGKMQDPSTSTMTGKVQMTPDNQIRWHFVSGDLGNAIWSSEGVQVGGQRSFFGILGSWTTIFHEDGDPVGPFWMRRLKEDTKVTG